jgi:hypothetical protein
MKALKPILLTATTVIMFFAACEPLEKVSEVPEIQFKSFSLVEIDTLDITIKAGELVFDFIDGNADFGIIQGRSGDDTLNLFLLPYQKVDGAYDSIDAATYGRSYAILNDEHLVRVGQNKTIKGEIKLQIFYFIDPPFDTIRYDFYVLDRAGNKSNVENTTDIGF